MVTGIEPLAEQLRAANWLIDTDARAVSVDGRPAQFGYVYTEAGRLVDIGATFAQQVPTGYTWSVLVDGVFGDRRAFVRVRWGVSPDLLNMSGEAYVRESVYRRDAPPLTMLTGMGPVLLDGRAQW